MQAEFRKNESVVEVFKNCGGTALRNVVSGHGGGGSTVELDDLSDLI